MKNQYLNIDMSFWNEEKAVVRVYAHLLDKQPDMIIKCEVWNDDSHSMEYQFTQRMEKVCSGMLEKTFPVTRGSHFTAKAAAVWFEEEGKLNFYDSERLVPACQTETISATVSVTKPRARYGREVRVSYYREGDFFDYSYPENRIQDGKFKVLMPFAGTVRVDSTEWDIVDIADGTVPEYPAPALTMLMRAGGSVKYEREIIPQLKILDKKNISWELIDDWNCMFDASRITWDSVLDFLGEFCIRLQNTVDPNLYHFEKIVITSAASTGSEMGKQVQIEPIRLFFGCMAEDTKILMDDGTQKVISEIRRGDMVLTNEGTAQIRDVIVGIERTLVHITTADGSTVRLTAKHPVLTTRGYVCAGQLNATDVMIMHGDEKQSLSALYTETYNGKVFNLDTTKPGTALVGNGFWVGDFDMQNSFHVPIGQEEPESYWMRDAKRAFGSLAEYIEITSLDKLKGAFCAAGAGSRDASNKEVLSVDMSEITNVLMILDRG